MCESSLHPVLQTANRRFALNQHARSVLFRAAANDIFIRCLVFLTRFVAKGWFAPRRQWRFTSDWSASFTTTVWVIVRVHYNTAYFRTTAEPATTTSFTK